MILFRSANAAVFTYNLHRNVIHFPTVLIIIVYQAVSGSILLAEEYSGHKIRYVFLEAIRLNRKWPPFFTVETKLRASVGHT